MANVVYPAGEPGHVGEDLQPRRVDIVAYRGDDFDIEISLLAAGNLMNMTGWEGRCKIKKGSVEHDATITVSDDGLSFHFIIDNEITSQMTGAYIYDVEFTELDGRIKTYMVGTVTITDDVTN